MKENSLWPKGTPQEVIDEITALIDKEIDEYKDLLCDSIKNTEKQHPSDTEGSSDTPQ